MNEIFFYIFIIYILICMSIAIMAGNRQIGVINSLLVCIITTPIIGFILAVMSPKKVQEAVVEFKNKADEVNSDNYLDELVKLNSLKEKGIITDEEFVLKKKKILNR